MGSKPTKQKPPPPPPPIPKTAEAYQAGDAEVIRQRRGSSSAQTFLVGGNATLGGSAQKQPGYTSFLGQ